MEMTCNNDVGLGHGTNGSPQESIEEKLYELQVEENESKSDEETHPIYSPSPKHSEKHGWGSANPIKNNQEGQALLDDGFWEGRQAYNVTKNGKIVKFQPSNTPYNEYHSYEVSKPRDIPSGILKQMLNAGKITRSEYNRFRKGKR